jgi:hypothetical protein
VIVVRAVQVLRRKLEASQIKQALSMVSLQAALCMVVLLMAIHAHLGTAMFAKSMNQIFTVTLLRLTPERMGK